MGVRPVQEESTGKDSHVLYLVRVCGGRIEVFGPVLSAGNVHTCAHRSELNVYPHNPPKPFVLARPLNK